MLPPLGGVHLLPIGAQRRRSQQRAAPCVNRQTCPPAQRKVPSPGVATQQVGSPEGREMTDWSLTTSFTDGEQMSRADELAMIEDCLGDIVRNARVDPDTSDLACLFARFVHLVAEKEARDDAAHWEATVDGPSRETAAYRQDLDA